MCAEADVAASDARTVSVANNTLAAVVRSSNAESVFDITERNREDMWGGGSWLASVLDYRRVRTRELARDSRPGWTISLHRVRQIVP